MGVPDGANAEGANADETEPRDPGTPADQVHAEITAAEVTAWWKSLFGFGEPQPYEAGGGGTGGQFMFASIDELNGVITKWEEERDGILADRDAIAEAYYSIAEPASDDMSQELAGASRDSLANMWQHSDAMLKYAENYIAKLYASRDQIAVMEDGARDRMRTVQA